MRCAFLLVALGGLAAPLRGQGGQPPPPPPPPDTVRVDTNAVVVAPRDSVKTPYTVGEAPTSTILGRPWRWNREQIFQSTAVNVAELIAQIPGARMMRSGLMLAPQVIPWLGEPGRVRVFLDGVELDNLDPRTGKVQDLGTIALWNLEEVRAEPTPSELRVYLRSWRIARTTAETRVDVLTGEDDTNLYRGFYGRRFQSGLGFQFGFQQFSTASPREGGDGDAFSLFTRLGWAHNALSIDVMAQRDSRTRNATLRLDEPGSVPPFTGSTLFSYLRAGIRSPDQDKPWAQLIVSGTSFNEETPVTSLGSAFGTVPLDSADTNKFRAQYLATGGVTVWGVRATAAARYRVFDHQHEFTPSARLSWTLGPLSAQGFAERDPIDSVFRTDVGARLAVFPWLVVSGQASRRTLLKRGEADTLDTPTFANAELSVRALRWWLTTGVILRPELTLAAPVVYARGIAPVTIPAVKGGMVGLWGPLYKAIALDVRGTVYEDAGPYRPQNEIRAKLWLETDWRSRFPRGDFTVRMSVLYEHVGGMLIPLETESATLLAASPVSTLLEIRIKSATISWQFRNITGTEYETVPGYRMPARINLYGIRWNFTN